MLASIYRLLLFLSTDAFKDRTCMIPPIKFQNIKTNMFEKGATVSLEGWSVVECGMYLAAACLPMLRPVVEKAQKWKVKFSIYGISRYNRTESSMDHSSMNRALPSNVTKLGAHGENPGSLEMGTATFVNEVNGRSVSETCLVHPEGIEVTNEISVSVTHLISRTSAL